MKKKFINLSNSNNFSFYFVGTKKFSYELRLNFERYTLFDLLNISSKDASKDIDKDKLDGFAVYITEVVAYSLVANKSIMTTDDIKFHFEKYAKDNCFYDNVSFF